jgi:hypothetical protein
MQCIVHRYKGLLSVSYVERQYLSPMLQFNIFAGVPAASSTAPSQPRHAQTACGRKAWEPSCRVNAVSHVPTV